MARSYRHTPICGMTTARSEKRDKQIAHRQYRRVNKQRIEHELEPLQVRETSNVWLWDKDGRQLFDAARHPKLMRK